MRYNTGGSTCTCVCMRERERQGECTLEGKVLTALLPFSTLCEGLDYLTNIPAHDVIKPIPKKHHIKHSINSDIFSLSLPDLLHNTIVQNEITTFNQVFVNHKSQTLYFIYLILRLYIKHTMLIKHFLAFSSQTT